MVATGAGARRGFSSRTRRRLGAPPQHHARRSRQDRDGHVREARRRGARSEEAGLESPLLMIAAALEASPNTPLAHAVTTEAAARTWRRFPSGTSARRPGAGFPPGSVRTYFAGNARWAADCGTNPRDLEVKRL